MLTKEQILPLIETHQHRYRTRFQKALQGIPTFSTDAGYYLELWNSIEAKGGDWEKMTVAERREATDAFYD